jgi:hypothetical protein
MRNVHKILVRKSEEKSNFGNGEGSSLIAPHYINITGRILSLLHWQELQRFTKLCVIYKAQIASEEERVDSPLY